MSSSVVATASEGKLVVGELSVNDRARMRHMLSLRRPVDIVDGGQVVGRLEPVMHAQERRPMTTHELDMWWNEHDRLAEEISQHWPEGVSVADAIADVRRDL